MFEGESGEGEDEEREEGRTIMALGWRKDAIERREVD